MESVNRVRSIRIGTGLMVLAALQWGMIGVAGRVAMAGSVPPLTVAFWRAALGALLFAAHARWVGAGPLRAEDRAATAGLGFGGVALMYLAYLNCVQQGGAALAAILLYSAPLWVAVGAWIFWKERPGFRGSLPLGSTLAGVVTVAMASGGGPQSVRISGTALGWGLVSGLSYSLYYLLGRRLFARNSPARVLAWALTIGAVALFPFVSVVSMPGRAWAATAFLAVVCTYGAYFAYAGGLQRLGPSRASTNATLEPVVAVVAAYHVWGEQLSAVGLAGATAVIGGVVWSAREDAGDDSPDRAS